jgi:two-component system, OmpR family, alkaline phosphatase synthesis response regulator PhoP
MPKRVLLVDDEDDIREVAGMSLETVAGWSILAARSGREGLKIAAEQQPDAILLDVMMPDMDGPSTFKNLQENDSTKSIPVIFLTAKAQTREQRGFRELGAQGVISKPFDPLTLADQVAEILGWK